MDSDWGGARKPQADPTGGWGGGQAAAGAGVPRQEKYDLEPYDDDDYEEDVKPSGRARGGYQVGNPVE